MRQKKYTFSLIIGLMITSLCVGQQLSHHPLLERRFIERPQEHSDFVWTP
jgi:hypothetical protein